MINDIGHLFICSSSIYYLKIKTFSEYLLKPTLTRLKMAKRRSYIAIKFFK